MRMLNNKPTQRQRDFVHYYIQNGMNAYQAGLSAGYSRATAKDAKKNIMEKHGVKQLIRSRVRAIHQRNKRHDNSDYSVIENLYSIATGSMRKSHYAMNDKLHPENSVNQIIYSPAPIRIQVKAIDLVLKYKGLEHASSKSLENAQIGRERAETKLDRVKAVMSHKIDVLNSQLTAARIRKTRAEAKIKELLAKQDDTSNNQTISKVDELLDAIFKDDRN